METDEQLMCRVQKKDDSALALLIDRYEAKLSRYLRRLLRDTHTADDCLQETFVKVYTHAQSYNSVYPFSPWIYRIAHNAAMTELRRYTFLSKFTIDLDALSLDAYSPPEENVLDPEVVKVLIDGGLEKLKPAYREVLQLYYIEELSYADISEVLQMPVSTVGVKIKRGRDALQNILKEEYDTLT